MKKYFMLTLLAFALPVMAADKPSHKAAGANNFKTIQVAELEKMISAEKNKTFIYDANNNETRKKEGVIPAAKALPKVSDYDTALLPADKKANLVFYCANTMCTASHDAAKVAMKAGYTNVYVLSPGIKGWKEAGKNTETFTN